MHPNDPPTSIPLPLDVSELLLKDYPLLQAKEEYAVFVPSKFVTAQWDTTDPSIPEAEINIIENRYKEQGYEIVRVGGEASIPDMNDSIQAIGYAMAKADGHIGIDSGFMAIYIINQKTYIYIQLVDMFLTTLFVQKQEE